MCLNCRCQNCKDGDCDKRHDAHETIRRVKRGEIRASTKKPWTREEAIDRIARLTFDGDVAAARMYYDDKYNWVKELGPLYKDDRGGTV